MLIAWLDHRQPHLRAAFDAGHFYAGLEARAGWRRPKSLRIGSPCPPEQFEATPLTVAANHYATLLTSLESAGNPYRYGRAKEIIPEYGGARRANGRPP